MKQLLVVVLLCGACSSTWDRYPMSLYAALRADNPTAIVDHQHLLRKLVDSAESSGRQPPAGIAAELAYYSWRIGDPVTAQWAIAKERQHYPQSERFLVILERFLPSLAVVDLPKEGATTGGTDDSP